MMTKKSAWWDCRPTNQPSNHPPSLTVTHLASCICLKRAFNKFLGDILFHNLVSHFDVCPRILTINVAVGKKRSTQEAIQSRPYSAGVVNTIIHNNMTNQATEEANYIASTVSSPCLPFLVARLPSKLKSTTATIIMFGWALDSHHLGCQSNYSVTNRFAMKSALIPLSKDSHTQHERQCQISIKLNPISSPKNLYPIPPLSSAHQSLHCSACLPGCVS